MWHYHLDCYTIFMSPEEEMPVKHPITANMTGRNTIKPLYITETATDAACSAAGWILGCIFVDNQSNVNEVSGYFQHSTVWQLNIMQVSETSTVNIKLWSQNESSEFCTTVKKQKGVHDRFVSRFLTIPITFSTLGASNRRQSRSSMLRKSEPTKKPEMTVAWQRQPTIFPLLIVVWLSWIGILLRSTKTEQMIDSSLFHSAVIDVSPWMKARVSELLLVVALKFLLNYPEKKGCVIL